MSDGLSPRGRGKRGGNPRDAKIVGSIPAWAGETYDWIAGELAKQVYPRVGGGNGGRKCPCRRRPGLSPRGRGKPRRPVGRKEPAGSIPAWAGETAPQSPGAGAAQVYPRVGGGNASIQYSLPSPWGLSPRGRGKHEYAAPAQGRQWSIPAWAGETGQGYRDTAGPAVYPRVGGGNKNDPQTSRTAGGLSPRGRGKLLRVDAGAAGPGSIPAWAGETRRAEMPKAFPTVYPRVGGGNGSRTPFAQDKAGLSPRGRGKPLLLADPLIVGRSIPAWAGETPNSRIRNSQ